MKEEKVIIKKVKKVGHGGDHGGSWKVAYADFVTAMMALFLCLFVNMISPEKRTEVAHYFKQFSIFDQSGTSFMQRSDEILIETGEAVKKIPSEWQDPFNSNPEKSGGSSRKRGDTEEKTIELEGTFDKKTKPQEPRAQINDQEPQEPDGVIDTPEELKEAIKKVIEEKLADIKDQVIVDTFEGGVRIQLVDNEGKPMFELGSSKPSPLAKQILQVIADNIKFLPHRVAIEGHTDSLPYKSGNYTNWDLSTERALSAKRELEGFGLSPERLVKIAGYADTVPLVEENPKDPRNRRISILLIFLNETESDEAEHEITMR